MEGNRADPRRLVDFLRDHYDEIIAAWAAAVRKLRPAKALSRPSLLDDIPDFLRDLTAFVGELREGHEVPVPQQVPAVHALERLDQGYELTEVVAEYGILRRCIVELAVREGTSALRSAEMPRLHEAIDQAISTSVQRYAQARDRTLKALDRISTAALGVHDVSAFLPKTLEALLETTAAVDSASLLLVDGEALRVQAAAGFALPPQEAPALAKGECFAGMVWQTRKPLLLRDASTDPAVKFDIVRKQGTHALYGVPLEFGDQVIGVALMGSCSTYEFSREDLLLFRTAANRAAALIAHARLDAEVRRQRTLYETMLRALSDVGEGFLMLEGTQVVYVNDAFCRMVGITADEAARIDVFDLVVPEQRAMLRRRLEDRMRGEIVPDHYEAKLLHRAGHVIDVEVAVKRLEDGRIVVIDRDISAHKRGDQEREDLVSALKEERSRLQAILDNLPMGIVIVEAASGRAQQANAQAQRILGRRALPGSVVDDYTEWRGFDADGRPYQADQWPIARAVQQGEIVQGEEIGLERADGTKAVISFSAAPIRSDDGRIVAAVAVLDDVTEKKRTENELRATLSFRDRIMSVLSHDLRQPLTVIMASASILLQKKELEPHTAVLTRQLRSAERIEHLIRDLLDYTRSQQGIGIPLRVAPTNLETLVRELLDAAQSLHPDRQYVLTVTGECTGEWDPDRITQVFSNLLSNAMSYSPKDSPIDVRLGCEGSLVRADIHNTGPPIPAELLPVVFEPFERGKDQRPGSLGLGLYIVQQIVASHGGSVSVRSTAEEGTTFTVTLPKT